MIPGGTTTQAISVAPTILLGSTAALQVAMIGAMSRASGSVQTDWVSLLGAILGGPFNRLG